MERTSYEDVQYESKPHFPMHVDSLGTLGHLFGMRPAPARKCRVLELGCATAMNIICMAEALPESQFVGLDLSPSQIDEGNRIVAAAGLNNVKLHAASIMDVDESWGEFDYILSHGVFSWVPTVVQDGLLDVCRRLLAPQGLAYISYNTYPGWHLRAIVREMMQYHSASFTEPRERVHQAKALLGFMAKSAPDLQSPYARLLAEEAAGLADSPDSYLFHEHLEEVNAPLYFHQFIERAGKFGLQYVSEAWQHMQLDDLPAEVSETLQGISHDLIQLEQFADFLTNRTFRRTLLCRADVQLDRAPTADVISSLSVSALAQPVSAQPDLRSNCEEQFKMDSGGVVRVTFPIAKTALVRLFHAWPRAIPFDQLLSESLADLGLSPSSEAGGARPELLQQQRDLLAAILLRGHLAHFAVLQREPFPVCQQVGAQPRSHSLARLFASRSRLVPNRRHKMIEVSPADRLLLTLADGSRTTAELAAAFAAAGAADADQAEVVSLVQDPAQLAAWIDTTLQRFASQALLV
jgi:cyclopropane fatty-acyl-phospholipid synthase-like methyltransferase